MRSMAYKVMLFAVMACHVSLSMAGEFVVSIEHHQYQPKEIKVGVGDSVKWVNNEQRSNHSVWFKEEGVADSGRFFPGDAWSRTFDKPGRYPYLCEPHPEMSGVVVVE